jgi:hypothetical protein
MLISKLKQLGLNHLHNYLLKYGVDLEPNIVNMVNRKFEKLLLKLPVENQTLANKNTEFDLFVPHNID